MVSGINGSAEFVQGDDHDLGKASLALGQPKGEKTFRPEAPGMRDKSN
jgi:hypothetical protein